MVSMFITLVRLIHWNKLFLATSAVLLPLSLFHERNTQQYLLFEVRMVESLNCCKSGGAEKPPLRFGKVTLSRRSFFPRRRSDGWIRG